MWDQGVLVLELALGNIGFHAFTVLRLTFSTPHLVVDLICLNHFSYRFILLSDMYSQPGSSGFVTGFLVHGAGPEECTLAHSN